MKSALIIANPKAGKSRTHSALYGWVDTLSRADYSVSVALTRRAGHATEIAREQSPRHDIVVCAGGDGTLNEVVTGVMQSGAKCSVGYIPIGSTNDFATTLNLSKNPQQAIRDIIGGVRKKVDVGAFNDRFFMYTASFGAFTKASYSTPQESKNAIGHLAYILEGIKDIPSIRAERIRIETPGKNFEGEYIFGSISNSTSLGGVLSLDDKLVMMNDGKFELLLVKKPENMAELSICITALLSQDYAIDMIDFIPIKSAEIYSSGPITWSIDGERADTDGRVTVKNLRHALPMILPTAAVDSSIL